MKIKPDYSLYLVTDRSFLHGRSLEEVTASRGRRLHPGAAQGKIIVIR